jgi:hypothetical protein
MDFIQSECAPYFFEWEQAPKRKTAVPYTLIDSEEKVKQFLKTFKDEEA